MTQLVGMRFHLEIDNKPYQIEIKELNREKAKVLVNGREIEVVIQSSNLGQESTRKNQPDPVPYPTPSVGSPASSPPLQSSHQTTIPSDRGGSKSVNAVMPGVVTRLVVEPGKQVSTGDVLLVLEAMKMENEIRSDRSGKVRTVHVSVGQQVQAGDPLISFA